MDNETVLFDPYAEESELDLEGVTNFLEQVSVYVVQRSNITT